MVITQIGLAVGDTEQERQKAEFTKLKAWVGNILNVKLLHTVTSIDFRSSMELPKKFDNCVKSLKYYIVIIYTVMQNLDPIGGVQFGAEDGW